MDRDRRQGMSEGWDSGDTGLKKSHAGGRSPVSVPQHAVVV